MASCMESFKKCGIIQVCFIVVFFTTGVVVNILQVLLYFGLKPYKPWLFRKLNGLLNYAVYGEFVWISDWWANLELLVYMDPEERKYCGKEHCLGLLNHSYEIDWLMAAIYGERFGILGNCRVFLKKSLLYIPIMGPFWKFTECVFLERSLEKDEKNIKRQIKELGDFPDPVMLLFLPEGTRFTPEKHKASQEFAAQRNLPQLKYHLQPRTNGFATVVTSMRDKIKCVYDITLVFKEDETANKPTVINLLQGKPVTAYVYIKRFHVDDLPQSSEGLKEFCRQSMLKKDKLKDSFLKTGDFFATSGVPRVEMYRAPRRIYSMLNMAGWTYVTYMLLKGYFIDIMMTGNLYVIAAVMILFSGMVYMGLSATQVKKGSSYGLTIEASHRNGTARS